MIKRTDDKSKGYRSMQLALLCVAFLSVLWVLSLDGDLLTTSHPILNPLYGTVKIVNDAQKPNATAMQVHNDNRKFETHRDFQFQSHLLGSPCQQTSKKLPSSTKNDIHDRCSQISFPLSKEGDQIANIDECWPRLVMIVSFPTSGNFMARMLFSLNTGLATGQKGCQETIFDWGGWSTLELDSRTFCDSNLELPYAGRVALLKTHRRPERHNIIIEDDELKNQEGANLPSHIVRLVRNPGDHMLREASRMLTESETNNNHQQFLKLAKSACDNVMEKQAKKFIYFHKKWAQVSRHIPSIMLHYEEMTDPDIVGDRMSKIVEFVGETERFDVNYDEVIKRPKYQHGTLFKEMCGIEKARKLHELTKEAADATGYVFDWQNGVWHLRDDVSINGNLHRFVLKPNATAMQIHNDLRKIEDVSAYKMQSNVLGSPCYRPPQEMLWTENREVDNYCSKLTFPLSKLNNTLEFQTAHPPGYPIVFQLSQCWPRLAIISSYPTSGSFMARMLFSISTGLATGTRSGGGKKGMIYDWGGASRFKIQGAFCDSNLHLPYAGRVALLKTHRLPQEHKIFIEGGVLKNEGESQIPSHIVRLVRNPGDHLLREASKMLFETQTNNDYDEFAKQANKVCDEVMKKVPGFLSFHKEWEKASRHIPTIMFPYEEMTNPDIVGKRMSEILEFLGETQRFDVNYANLVRLPRYQHGTLFKEMCGLDAARRLHRATRDVDDIIGYTFDWEAGVWHLRDAHPSS